MATQSNDYAFGAPILAALYSQSHPEFLPLIYLLAPISLVRRRNVACIIIYGSIVLCIYTHWRLTTVTNPIHTQVILNPLAFVLCELGLLQEKADQPPQPQPPSAEPPPPRRSRPSPLVSDDDDDDENEGQNRPLATAAAAASSSSSSSLSANGEEEEDSDPSTGGNVTYWRGAPLVLFYGDGDRRTASRAGGGGDGTAAGTAAAKPPPLASSSVWSSVLRQVASNPVVVMTFLGLVTGAGLQGKGLPPVLAKVCVWMGVRT